VIGCHYRRLPADGAERAVARVTAWLLATSDTGDVASDRYPPLVEGDAQPVPAWFDGLDGFVAATSGWPLWWMGPTASAPR
jgi:hypothetical protein